MKLADFFAKHPVFTVQELDQFLARERTGNISTRRALLAHHRKMGRILPVRRGLYVSVPPGESGDTFSSDPYLLASRMTEDALLAYHTALEFHGKAHSVFTRFYYLSRRQSLPVTFRSLEFRNVIFPKALREEGEELQGVSRMERAGLDVRVTELERTLVDVMDRPDLCGGWEEIWRSLESVEFFDLDRVIKYALLLGNATTIAKVGFFLEQHRESLMVEQRHLKSLREHRPKRPHYMVLGGRKPGHLVSDWNLVVTREVLERSWEEVT